MSAPQESKTACPSRATELLLLDHEFHGHAGVPAWVNTWRISMATVTVSMVQIGVVGMGMDHRFMLMGVGMWLRAVPLEFMGVLVVIVMRMQVIVLQWFVLMRVLVALADMQPDAQAHERAGSEPRGQGDRDDATDSDSVTVQCPSLSITKTADAAEVAAGGTIGFVITVSNAGAGAAYNVSMTDTLPAGVSWSIDAGNTEVTPLDFISYPISHSLVGALAWGIGTSELTHVLATQTIVQQRPKTMRSSRSASTFRKRPP